ncbi:MAG: NUDIX domain-containing protein [Scrofimicrobium sp.]
MPDRSIIFPRGMVRSAGAVVWRFAPGVEPVEPGEPIAPGDIEVLLVHRPRYRDWSWPKGKAERNEPLPVTAVREVEEETGKVIELGAPLTTQRYRLGSGHIKEVHYWVGQVIRNHPARSTRRPVTRANKKEIDIVKWVAPERARAMITRKGDRRLLTELIGRGAAGDLQTSTIMLLRHAKAVAREKWEGTEAERPLTRVGVAEASDMVDLLSAFGITRVVTSPWRRCEQTVLPYAVLGSADVKRDEVLTEDWVRDDPAESSKVVAKLIKGRRAATVVCFHGPGLEALEKPLREIASKSVLATMNHPDPMLNKAEMLVAHVTLTEKPRVLEAERHHPLTKLTLK